jgi:hypothetical protein
MTVPCMSAITAGSLRVRCSREFGMYVPPQPRDIKVDRVRRSAADLCVKAFAIALVAPSSDMRPELSCVGFMRGVLEKFSEASLVCPSRMVS